MAIDGVRVVLNAMLVGVIPVRNTAPKVPTISRTEVLIGVIYALITVPYTAKIATDTSRVDVPIAMIAG
jgi:hypothetical protein